MLKNKGISKNQNYGDDFQDWEIAIITKLVHMFQLQWDCLKGVEEFEDLRQECFIHWLYNRDKYDNSKSANPRTYMAEVIRNKLKDIRRKKFSQKRAAELNLLSLDQPLNNDDESIELQDILGNEEISPNNFQTHELIELNVQIRQVIDQLNPQQKKMCDLSMQGYTKVDIAKLLKVPRTTLNDEFKRIERLFSRKGLRVYLDSSRHIS